MMDYILKKEGIEYWLYQDDKLIAHTPMKAKDYFESQEDYHAYCLAMKPVAEIWKDDENTLAFLNLEQIHSLLGIVDIERRAEEMYAGQLGENFKSFLKDGFIEGYKQCLEDNKNKKWTDKDIRKAIQLAWEADSIDGTVDLNVVLHFGNNNDLRTKWNEEEILQSLQPKTECEVEVEEELIKIHKHTNILIPTTFEYAPKITNGYINILKIK